MTTLTCNFARGARVEVRIPDQSCTGLEAFNGTTGAITAWEVTGTGAKGAPYTIKKTAPPTPDETLTGIEVRFDQKSWGADSKIFDPKYLKPISP